jgi:hypothetical protein
MNQQQNNNGGLTWKQHFNLVHLVCMAHQRCLVMFGRNQWGKEALGTPCCFAIVLMFLWTLFSHDDFMWGWMGLWGIFFAKRRSEALQLAAKGARIHSWYDGWPFDAIRYCQTEYQAKRFVEPLLCGVLGGILFVIYQENGLPVHGLPYFLLAGLFTLPFVETVKQTIWDKRIEAANDAQIEAEQLTRDRQERYGDS